MTTRNWKLIGLEYVSPADITISIDGTEVFNGAVSSSSNAGVDYIAQGTFDLDDAYDTKHAFSLTVNTGSIMLGAIHWNNAQKTNPDLTSEELSYVFDVNNAPQSIKDSVAAKGGWSTKDPNFYSFFPGRNTIYPTGTDITSLDSRLNFEIDGTAVTGVATNGMTFVPAGATATFEFGIPGDTSGDDRP